MLPIFGFTVCPHSLPACSSRHTICSAALRIDIEANLASGCMPMRRPLLLLLPQPQIELWRSEAAHLARLRPYQPRAHYQVRLRVRSLACSYRSGLLLQARCEGRALQGSRTRAAPGTTLCPGTTMCPLPAAVDARCTPCCCSPAERPAGVC